MKRPDDRLEARLTRLFDLEPVMARRIVDELLDALELTADDYITARHAELQRGGYPNDQIYQRIQDELQTLRFKAPALSVRQIRRRIYG